MADTHTLGDDTNNTYPGEVILGILSFWAYHDSNESELRTVTPIRTVKHGVDRYDFDLIKMTISSSQELGVVVAKTANFYGAGTQTKTSAIVPFSELRAGTDLRLKLASAV